jgi:hypothetical protein
VEEEEEEDDDDDDDNKGEVAYELTDCVPKRSGGP